MGRALEGTAASEMFSRGLRALAPASLGPSLWRWPAAPGRLKVKTTSATRRGKDEEGRSSTSGGDAGSTGDDGGGELRLEPVPGPDRAEAALLPPAAHLIMVVC